jgi:hypothetical protein
MAKTVNIDAVKRMCDGPMFRRAAEIDESELVPAEPRLYKYGAM